MISCCTAPDRRTWPALRTWPWWPRCGPTGPSTIDGDSGPEPTGRLAVTINGPFLPADSVSYNGMPIYAYVRP